MNPQPVSLADELRKLGEQLKDSYCGHQMGHCTCQTGRNQAAKELSALLAQHAVAEPPWKCKANRTADPPQDCDWPGCGCDPYANKVLEAIEESGFKIVRAPHAVEQPKLTGLERKVIDAAKRKRQIELGDVDNAIEELGDAIDALDAATDALLTSPVAPPPQIKEKSNESKSRKHIQRDDSQTRQTKTPEAETSPQEVDNWKCENCGAALCYHENCHSCGPFCHECAERFGPPVAPPLRKETK